jgi:hypothetical protein
MVAFVLVRERGSTRRRFWQRGGNVRESEESEANGGSQARCSERLTAFGTDIEVRGGEDEAKPAGWAAEASHGWGHRVFFPGRPRAHLGQTRSMMGSSERSSSSSK